MATKVITPPATLSYPNLFEPRETPSGDMKYNCSLVWKSDADLTEMKAAAMEAAKTRWGDKAEAMIKKGQLRWPFRDGAERDAAGYGEGTVFMNMNSSRQPGVVSKYAGPDKKPLPITDPEEVYPGCIVRASVNAFAYDVSGSKGVSFGLNNVQKLDEGPRLDGRRAAEDDFEALEDQPATFDGEAEQTKLFEE